MAGCGGGDGEKIPEKSTSSAVKGDAKANASKGQPQTVMAEMRGTDGLLIQVSSVERDSGGFVTVTGTLKNDGAKLVAVPAQVSGDEREIVDHGVSLGGATLVDSQGKKRYYVLRDTEGRPLTTTGLTTLEAGQNLPVFMQFPAPPASTTEVTLQLPTFSSATVKISG
jgi:hypothetical protein